MSSREQRVGETFVALADMLVSDFDLTELLHTLTSTSVELLDVDAAGILLVEPGGALRVVAASDDTLRALELFELQSEQGPCYQCLGSGTPIVVADLMNELRWPMFVPRAVEAGYRSVDALPMRLRAERVGVLNLFSETPGALSSADVALAQAMADVAAIGLIQGRLLRESQLLASQLQHALTARVVIEQAKGMIAEQSGLQVSAAFEVIRAHARRTSTRVSDLARAIVDGEVDHEALSAG